MPFMERCRERYGDVFTLTIRNELTWVMLADPDHVRQVFTGDPRLLHAGEANLILRPIVGERSVLTLDESPHMTQRKLMLPPFHGERMQRYGELMEQVTRAELESWPRDEPLALWPRMQAITLEIIMRAVFGIGQGARSERLRELLRRMLDWTTNPRQLAFLALLGPQRLEGNKQFRRVMDPVDAAVLDEVRRRRADPGVADRDDILSMLVQARYEDGSPMSDRELRDELITLLVAGHETTATSLAWALERLMRHPDKLERLREEATAAGGSGEYADAVVKETLRLRPVLPIVLRRLTEPLQIGGYSLPAGVSVAPSIYLVHRREDVYPNAREFRPERFLESPAGTYTWIPFGGGVRRCLGASFAQFEMKTVLQTLVAELDLRPADPASERVVRRAITLTPDKQARALVRPRRAAARRAGDQAATVGALA